MDSFSLQQLLMSLGMQLPTLLVLGAGLIVLFQMPPGRPRTLAVVALAVLLLGDVLHGVVMVLAQQMIREPVFNQGLPIVRDALNDSLIPVLFSTIKIVFSLFRAVGYGLLLLALVRALRAYTTIKQA